MYFLRGEMLKSTVWIVSVQLYVLKSKFEPFVRTLPFELVQVTYACKSTLYGVFFVVESTEQKDPKPKSIISLKNGPCCSPQYCSRIIS